MASHLTHADIQELLGAFAVDATEIEEAGVIDAHLADCPRCRHEVAEHREAATLLSYTGAPAPEGMWSVIAAKLDETPPPLAMLQQLTPRRPRRPLVAMAAAVAAAVFVALGLQIAHQSHRIDQLAALSGRHGLDQAAAIAGVTPGARTVRLQSNDGTHVVDAVVLPDGHGYLVRADLPALGPSQTFQLWGVVGAQMISLGVLGKEPTMRPFTASGPLTALAITIEHTGGAVAPTTSPIVQGFITTA